MLNHNTYRGDSNTFIVECLKYNTKEYIPGLLGKTVETVHETRAITECDEFTPYRCFVTGNKDIYGYIQTCKKRGITLNP